MELNKKDKAKYKKEIDALNGKLKEKQLERFKNNVQNEYGVKEAGDYKFSIDASGRYGLDSYFTYTENFTGQR